MDTLLFVYEFKGSDRIVIYNCLTDYNCWFVVKDAWSGSEYPYPSWMDTLIKKNLHINRLELLKLIKCL